jgi:hypothetical protein
MQDTTQDTTVYVQHVIPTKWEQAKAARAARRHQAGAILRSIAEATERQRERENVQYVVCSYCRYEKVLGDECGLPCV